jgi:hypothetical protein
LSLMWTPCPEGLSDGGILREKEGPGDDDPAITEGKLH